MPFINGGHWWLILILVVVLIIFGPGRLPELGGALGRGIKEFRRATTELKDEVAKASAEHENKPPASSETTSSTPEPPKA